MTCRDVTDALGDYLSGELSAERMAEVNEHLATCADCTNYLTAYRQTLTLTKQAFDASEAPPAEVPDALVKAILAARRPN